MRRLAIIPARGGSKRVPGKNIGGFCGLPMIGHILQAATGSKLFNKIHVSTESAEVAKVVNTLGYTIDFMRPEYLADDFTPLMPVLKHVAETYKASGEIFTEIWLLMPCSPLIDTSDLIEASKFYQSFNGEYAVKTVAAYSAPIERAFSCDENMFLTPLNSDALPTRTQDLGVKYYDAGAFEIHSANDVLSSIGTVATHKFVAYVLPKFKAIDIDDAEDLALAEMIYRGYHNQINT